MQIPTSCINDVCRSYTLMHTEVSHNTECYDLARQKKRLFVHTLSFFPQTTSVGMVILEAISLASSLGSVPTITSARTAQETSRI